MSFISLLTVCVSLVIGSCGVAGIFVNGWVKASHITDLKAETNAEIKCLKTEIEELKNKVSDIKVVTSRLDGLEKGITEIKELIKGKQNV